LDAAYHRAVGRVVVVFVAIPLGIGSLLIGWALPDCAPGKGIFHGSEFFLLAGIASLIFGSVVLGVAGCHSLQLFR
jgi:hypothetical protein